MRKVINGLTDTGNLVVGVNVADTLPGYGLAYDVAASVTASPEVAHTTSQTLIGLASMVLIKVVGNLLDKWAERRKEKRAARKAKQQ